MANRVSKRPGPKSLFPGKRRAPVSLTLTPKHHKKVDDNMRRLGLTRADLIGLLIEKFADIVTLPGNEQKYESLRDALSVLGGRLAVEGNLDFCVAARNRGGDCGCDLIGALSNTRPLGAAGENDEGNAARTQVLLVADAPIGGEQHVEGCVLRSLQERTVVEPVPALGLCGMNGVLSKRADQPLGRTVVKEDEHR